MSKIGQIVWHDLTVGDAGAVKGFYEQVVGWKAADHDMGEYNDYDINTPDDGECVAGVCHARGENANIPPQWLIYVSVANVEQSAAKCEELGGEVVDGPRKMGDSSFCVVQDPACAVLALIEA